MLAKYSKTLFSLVIRISMAPMAPLTKHIPTFRQTAKWKKVEVEEKSEIGRKVPLSIVTS